MIMGMIGSSRHDKATDLVEEIGVGSGEMSCVECL
jgi:hypothetical protein